MTSLAQIIAVVEVNGLKRERAPTKDFPQCSIGGSNDDDGGNECKSRHQGRYKNLKHVDFDCDTELCCV